MSKPTCSCCRHWHPLYGGLGQCRRKLPVPVGMGNTVYPRTGEADSCREWESHPTRQPMGESSALALRLGERDSMGRAASTERTTG